MGFRSTPHPSKAAESVLTWPTRAHHHLRAFVPTACARERPCHSRAVQGHSRVPSPSGPDPPPSPGSRFYVALGSRALPLRQHTSAGGASCCCLTPLDAPLPCTCLPVSCTASLLPPLLPLLGQIGSVHAFLAQIPHSRAACDPAELVQILLLGRTRARTEKQRARERT